MKRRIPTLLAAQLGLTVFVFFALGVLAGDEGTFARIVFESETWLMILGLFAGVSVVQVILLAPVLQRRPRRERGVPVWVSLTFGAAMFALLTGTFALSIGQALFDEHGVSEATFYAGLAVAVASWVGGTIYFATFMRARPGATREHLLQRLAKGILAASLFETLANLPLDVMIRKKSNCHCGDASVLAFAASMSVGLVVFGPAVFLSILGKERAPWYRERCDACGVKKGETTRTGGQYRERPAEVCARCGYAEGAAAGRGSVQTKDS